MTPGGTTIVTSGFPLVFEGEGGSLWLLGVEVPQAPPVHTLDLKIEVDRYYSYVGEGDGLTIGFFRSFLSS